ncbi:MAG: hypothetical protein ACE5HZ_00910 [Fidelibacterota bacterium]
MIPGIKAPAFTVLILCGFLFAQPRFSGYFESELDQVRSRGTDYVFGYTKIRLDLEARPVEKAVLRANVNVQRFHGQERWDLFDFLPRRITDPLIADGLTDFPFELPDTLYLDNVYLKVSFPAYDLTLGKQQLSLGTGYAWNPLDIFNRKELLDPSYEQTGVEAVRMEVPLARRLLVDLIVAPQGTWDQWTRLIRAKVGVGRFDLTATAGSFQWIRTGLDPATYRNSPLVRNRTLVGWAAVGEWLNWGIWTEGGWNTMEEDDPFLEVLLGVDHTFDFSTYLLMEAYHSGSAVSRKDRLQLDDYLSYFVGQTHSLMRDYLFLYVRHPFTDLLTAGLFGIANLNDDSTVFSPLLEYSLLENVIVSLLASGSRGDKDSEFGLQDWGLRLRVRAYY